MKNLLGLSLLLIFVTGCSDPETAQFPNGVLKYDETAKDIQVEVNPYKETTSVSPSGTTKTAEIFEHFYIMQRLGERTSRSSWARDSQTHLLNFYDDSSTHSHVRFSESPYAEVFTASSQAEYMNATKHLRTYFAVEWGKLQDILAHMQENPPNLPESMTLSQAMQVIVDFMNQFETKLLKSNVDEAFKTALLSGIYEGFWLRLPASRSILRQLEGSADFEEALATLKGLISTMDIELNADKKGQIESASKIGSMLNSDRLKPKHVFNILVRLWDLMEDEERLENFGEVSPELYEYLSDKSKSRKGIECLKNRDCRTLVDKLAEKMVIAPEIKKYGVNKLRAEIEASAVVGLKEMLISELTAELPIHLADAIEKKIKSERDRLLAIREQYITYVKTEVQSWYETQYEKSTLPALERKEIQVLGNTTFTAPTKGAPILTNADTLGAAMLASAQMFRKTRTPLAKSNPEKLQLLGITRLGQLLAHSGFDMADGSSFQSLSRAFISGRPFNIEAGFEFPSLFTMGSSIQVSSGFDTIRMLGPNDWNVISQSRLLMGFSHKMDNFKDWEQSPMDEAIGQIQVKELLPGIPSDELETSAFPEEAFLAVSFGNAASILNNLKTTGTPLFIMCQKGEVLWADSEEECKKASALAGIVNVVNGKRQANVDIMSQAKFLESVVEFMKRSEVLVEKTNSEYLTEIRGSTSAVQDFNEVRPELRNLAMALTNFIISKFQDRNGGLKSIYSLNAKESPASGKASFKEHLQVTRALVASAEYFGIGPYERAAVRSYYGLNQIFYNPTTQFYKTGKADINTMDLARTLETLERLEPWIKTGDSRNQLNSLLEAWRNSLRPKSI